LSATNKSPTGIHPEADAGLVALIERLDAPMCAMDRKGVITMWNDAMGKALGWPADRAIGREALAMGVAPTDTADAVDITRQVARTGMWHGRFPVVKADGSRIVGTWLLATFDSSMLVVLLDGADNDSSDVDMAGAEEANLLLDGVLNSAPVAMAIFDRSIRYVRANQALAAINGIRAEDHVGVPLTKLLPELAEGPGAAIEQVFKTGEAIVNEPLVLSPRGVNEERHWLVSYYPISLRGEVRWVGTVIIDETERKGLLQDAQRTTEQLTRLQQITALLSGTRTREDVCTVLVNEGVAGVGATTAVLCLVTDDGAELELVRSVGLTPDVEENWRHFPIDAPVPASDAVRTGKAVLFSSLEERDRLYPQFSGQPSRNQAFATVPLTVGARTMGSVTFGWAEQRQFSNEDRRFLFALAEQCAQALDRCRLAVAEARERRRKEFIGEASAVLASSLDYQTTMERLARMVLPELADACAVHVFEGDQLKLVTVAHVDPAHEKLLLRLGERDGSMARAMRLLEVARTREPLLVESVTPDVWHAVARDDRQRVQLQRLGLSSGMAVPLVASGESLGVLSLGMSVSGRRYTADDIGVARELGDRAAVAIHNARTHRALRDVARTLQRSLLPSASPSIPGLDVAAAYHPVSDSEVGGDFYDVFPVGEGRWGVVIGDVCGKGVQAASLTALARYTVRTAAVGANSPSDVLSRLNQAVLDEGVEDRFCTIAHLIVEPGDGQAKVTLACGGHPLPLLVDAAGGLRAVGRPGSGIGMFPEPDLVDTVHTLGPGEALVLYTDGVLEARSPDGAFDPDLFTSALSAAAVAGADAAGLASAVEAAVLAFEGGRARDDMAVLVLRVPPA
jgi:PAS domain S-box-containing protein